MRLSACPISSRGASVTRTPGLETLQLEVNNMLLAGIDYLG